MTGPTMVVRSSGCIGTPLGLADLEAIAALHEAEIDIHSSGLLDCFGRIAAECTTIFTEGQGKLNFENGTLDLETMTLHPFKREDYLTYCLPYCYAPGKHPTINKFLLANSPIALPSEYPLLVVFIGGKTRM